MTPNPYKPRPGSTGERALAFLQKSGRTVAHDLAFAIDCESNSLAANLNLCVTNGLIKRELTGGRTFYDVPRPVEAFYSEHKDLPPAARPGADVDKAEADRAQRFDMATNVSSEFGGASPPPKLDMTQEGAFAGPGAASLDSTIRNGDIFVGDHCGPGAGSSNAQTEVAPPSSPPAPGEVEFRCAYYSDGRFVLVNGDVTMVLEPDAADILLGYAKWIIKGFGREEA